ncbi:MAG: hypothetical protein K0T99_01635 [Alphaproteobacteria bacterium]|nr:hypothetical protein [Alphaproteobacteria bacterium]
MSYNFYDRVQALKHNPCDAYMHAPSFKMSGQVEFLSGGNVAITREGDSSAYVVLNEKDINSNNIVSASDGFEFFVDKGSKATIHYGDGKSHDFILDPNTERNFYLDQDKNEIVFLDDRSCEGSDCVEEATEAMSGRSECWAWVIVGPWKYSSGCCNSGHSPGNIWGLVACNQEWSVSKCCPGVDAGVIEEG